MKYFASIISSQEDSQWAKSLYHKLETFSVPSNIRKEKPFLPLKLVPIFFNNTRDIPSGPIIWNHEQESEFLIVVCSANTWHKQWIMRDIDFFARKRNEANIIFYAIDNSIEKNIPEQRGLFQFANIVNVYEIDEIQAVSRVAEIMLGLERGTFDKIIKKEPFIKRLAQKVSFSSEKHNNTICVLESTTTSQSYRILNNQIVVGRGFDCGIRLNDSNVSRRAFVIEKNGNRWLIFSLSNILSISLNGERILSEEKRILQDGDQIKVSTYCFVVHIFAMGDFFDSDKEEKSYTTYTQSNTGVQNMETEKKKLKGEKQYSINSSVLTIRFGDILNSDAEVIVSSDDNLLSMGGGVSGAILTKGGMEILNDAKKNNSAQLGDVIITTAGKLPQKYIFHCITIEYAEEQKKASEDKGLQDYIIRRSTDKCLRMMHLLGIETIAFPTIGAGVAQFSLEEIATSMAEVITNFLFTTNKRYRIEIYLYDPFNQNGFMDYLTFFENVAKNIDNHQQRQFNFLESTLANEVFSKTEPQKVKPFGKMAAMSPHDEHKVFVSYSRDDIELAQQFCEQMDEMGVSYWIDVNGKYSGNNFKEVLVDAIDASKVMLFLSSIQSNNSPFVIKEISLAVAGNKMILPIKIDDAPYAKSIRFDLSDIDWIEYSGKQQDEAMEKFRYCLQLYIQ